MRTFQHSKQRLWSPFRWRACKSRTCSSYPARLLECERWQWATLQRLLESAKIMLRNRVYAFIQEAWREPLLISYANDATNLRSLHQVPFQEGSIAFPKANPEAKSMSCKKGVAPYEVLVQNLFLRYFGAGDPHSCTGQGACAVDQRSRWRCRV